VERGICPIAIAGTIPAATLTFWGHVTISLAICGLL